MRGLRPEVGDRVNIAHASVRGGQGQGTVVRLSDSRAQVEFDNGMVVDVHRDEAVPVVEIINCTPHPITVAGVTIQPSGVIPRAKEKNVNVGSINVGGVNISITETVFEEVEGLPEPREGIFLVVSRITAEAAPARDDLLIPGKQTRDAAGRITGCETLARIPGKQECP